MIDANLVCTYQSILSHNLTLQQKCNLLSIACKDQQFYINFFEFYYCKLAGKLIYLIPLTIFMLLLIFVFLNALSEQHISPALIYISKFLRVPKRISKITLLMLASNSDDFVASFVILKHKNQFGLFFGNLFGSVLLFLTAVLGICLKNVIIKIKLKKNRLIKDLSVLIILTILIIYYGYQKFLNSTFCLILIGLYILQVILEITKVVQLRKKSSEVIQQKDDEEKLELVNVNQRSQRRSFHDKRMLLNQIRILLKDYYDYVENKTQIRIENFSIEPYQKYFNFIDFPMKIVRYLTIPPSNKKSYSHDLTIIWPFGGLYFLAWYFFPIQKWQIFLMPICLGLSILFCKYNSGNVDEIPRYFIFLTIVSVLISLIWMKIIFTILIDFLVFIHILTNIRGVLIGISFLAWICALPEALTLLSIFKRQNSQLAFQGFLQGKIASLILNFGLVLLYYIHNKGNQKFDLFFEHNELIQLILVVFTFLTSLMLLIYGLINKMVFRRNLYIYLLGIYFAFVCLVAGATIQYQYFNQIQCY